MAKKKSKKLIWIAIIILLVVSILGAAVYFKGTQNKEILVQTSKVSRMTIVQRVSAIGKIQPETEVKISSEASGEIIFLGVKEGDTVRSNDLLVKINPDIIETQMEQLNASANAAKMDIEANKAELDRARAAFERITKLYQKEFASKEEFDRAKAQFDQANAAYSAALSRYDQAKATVNQMKKSAERTTIYAPIAGVVTKLDIEKGEKVVGTAQMQGTEMMRISDLSVMNAVVEVDENDIVLVSIGDTTSIEIDAFPNKIFKGIVTEIGHSAIINALGTQDQVTNFQVKIRLLRNNEQLRPGMSCSVDIETEIRRDVLAVPLQAVTVRVIEDEKNEERGVRKLNDNDAIRKDTKDKPQLIVFKNIKNKARKTKVVTGISDKGFIEIVTGLNEGDEIISGSFMVVSQVLEDGTKVVLDKKIKPKSDKKTRK